MIFIHLNPPLKKKIYESKPKINKISIVIATAKVLSSQQSSDLVELQQSILNFSPLHH